MVSFAPFWTQPYSQPLQLQVVGTLHETDNHGGTISVQQVYAHQEILIGRDPNRCQHVIHDAVVSNKHLRIYTIIFDDDPADGIAPLVYAEDLSQNGTYWNGSLIGKGNGGVLLSDGDTLRLSPRICYRFQRCKPRDEERPFDFTQECEMKNFEKEYVVSDRKLGSGASGQVFMAIEQSKRRQLACKMVDLRKLRFPARPRIGRLETAAAADDVDNGAQLARIQSWAERKRKENRLEQELKVCHREATILASLSHPNIISIEKVFITDNSVYIFQDLITGGDLFSFLERKNGKLSDVEAAVIVRQILIALEYLHEHNIVHRDLKPENILMTSLANGCRVVLTDFGHAKKIENDRARMTTMAGTEQYIAPEIAGISRHFNKKGGYTKAVDMWSLGCVTVVLLTGGSPFVHPKTHQYCQKLAQECDLQQLENDPEWKLVGKRPKDFVRRLLVLHEERRMTAKDAKQHSWFSNDFHRVDFETVYCRATRHWKPRPLKTPVLEVIDADQVKELPTLQKIELAGQGNDRRRSPVPVDPPYRPYPRKMSSFLLPKRRPGASFIMSDEVRTAIQEKWSLEKMKRQISEVAIDEVPALIPDTESDDQDEPHTKRRFQEQRTADATSGRKAAFTSPFRPLVQRPSSLNGKKVSNHDTTFGKSVVQDQPSHVNACHSGSQHGSADQTSRTNLDSPNQAKASQISTDSATSYDHSLVSKVPVVSTQDRSNHGASDLPTSNQTELSHSAKEGGIAPKVLQMVNHSPKSKIDEVAGGQDTKMKGGPNFASRGPDVNTTIDPTKSAQTSPQRVEKKAVALKLRSPLLARLNPVLRQQAKSKKRCGSIFDLDEDEDTEQRQHELSKLTLEADRAPKSGYFRKRPRIDQSVEVQTGSDEDSRFSIWSGGETLGIPGAFKNLSFSQ